MLPFNVETLSAEEIDKRYMLGTLHGAFYVSNEDYHKGPGLSSTDIKELLKSPAHFVGKKTGKSKPETKAKLFGTGTHQALFEPEVFKATVKILPTTINRRTNEGKAAYAAWMEAHKHCTLVTPDEYDQIVEIRDRMQDSPIWLALNEGAMYELACYAECPRTGVLLKSKADIIQDDTISDLKTTIDARPRAFAREIKKFDYHISGSFYLRVFNLALGGGFNKFMWIAVEKTFPFGKGFYPLSKNHQRIGNYEIDRALQIYTDCVASGRWPAYPDVVTDIDFDDWVLMQYPQEIFADGQG